MKGRINPANLQHYLDLVGWDNNTLAKKANVSRDTVNGLWQNSTSSVENTITKIVNALFDALKKRGEKDSDLASKADRAAIRNNLLLSEILFIPTSDPPPVPERFIIPEVEARNAAVLIPAAGPVPTGVMSHIMTHSISLISLGGRPILQRQVDYMEKQGFKDFYVGYPKNDNAVANFASSVFRDKNINTFPCAANGVAGAVETLAIEAQLKGAKAAFVLLGDTYVELEPKHFEWSAPFVLYVTGISHPSRWATVWKDDDGKYVYEEKNAAAPLGKFWALVGAYWFPDLQQLIDICKNSNPKFKEMSEILNKLPWPSAIPYKIKTWFDVGHPDLQVKANAAFIERTTDARFVHQLRINLNEGSLMKKISLPDKKKHLSKDEQKIFESATSALRDEIEYYINLPQSISVYFPRVLKACPHAITPSLKVEYYAYDTLSVPFLFGQLHDEIWLNIFKELKKILRQFASPSYQIPKVSKALRAMYLEKTKTRLDMIQRTKSNDPHVSRLQALVWHGGLVDGTPSRSLHDMVNDVKTGVEALINSCTTFTIIHGDFHNANILHDVSSGRIFRLLDPRGNFGDRRGIHGDPLYDLAKLFHSIDGLYDCLIHNMFSIDPSNPDLVLTIHAPTNHQKLVEHFKHVFIDNDKKPSKVDKERFTISNILLVNFLLFASMIPLHNENPRRQLAMAVRAIRYYRDWAEQS